MVAFSLSRNLPRFDFHRIRVYADSSCGVQSGLEFRFSLAFLQGRTEYHLHFHCAVGRSFFRVVDYDGEGVEGVAGKVRERIVRIHKKEGDDPNGNAVLKGLISYEMAHGYLKRISPEKISNCIFSLKAGAYSVSKINIMLGVISLVFWILVGIVHSLFAAPGFVDIGIDFFMTWSGYPIVFLALSAVLSFVICRLCKSSSM